MNWTRLVSAGLLLCSLAAHAEPGVVAISEGETPIVDIGSYTVFYQSYGAQPVEMPAGWTGSDPVSGICYSLHEPYLGRNPIMIHCPWKVKTGSTWADYPLELPRATPIRLDFGIAVWPDTSGKGKSDGVTFSCSLSCDGVRKELMRRHYTGREWHDCLFDLSAYAGKRVSLRLQVEPGPRNDPGWDFSLFGDPRIIVGRERSTGEVKARLVARLMDAPALRATRDASQRALVNAPDVGVRPSNLLPFTNRVRRVEDTWRFEYAGDDCTLAYVFKPVSGTPEDFVVETATGQRFRPAAGSGLHAALEGKEEPVPLSGGRATSVTPAGENGLTLVWEYDLGGNSLRVKWDYEIRGKTLCVGVSCGTTSITAFSLGNMADAHLRRLIPVPYLAGQVAYLADSGLFVSRRLDWTISHASTCPEGVATYDRNTRGARNALYERGIIAVSPDIDEVLPNLPHPTSPFIRELAPRIMLDIWGHHNRSYAGDAEKLTEFKDNGIDHLAIIQHVWQRYGYDVKLPDHLPADPRFGGDEGMNAFGRAANECGFLWSVHENYIDLYPDAPSYNPADRVLNEDGSPSKAWFNSGTGVQSFGLKCTQALRFARQNAPEIHRRFGTTAAYLDVHSCVPPWHQLDHDASQPMAAMALTKVEHDTQLFQFMRDTHHGPLFGEGNQHFYWGGRCDGVEAQVQGGEDHVPLLDFDLLKLHPQMVNHGMGYYQRWYRHGYDCRWGRDAGAPEQADKYRIQEIAYGHAGFVGEPCTANTQWVAREHHLVHPVQRLYAVAVPVEIRYEVAGRMVPASVAVAARDTWRQRISYSNGLRVWANWSAKTWNVEGHELPQWGFLALGPGTEVHTSLCNRKFCDYAECPEYVFADSRTWFDMPWRKSTKKIEPRLRSLRNLGKNRAELTFEWIVNDTLDTDYSCFVHGVFEQGRGRERIAFQLDHRLSRPTSSWREGDVVVDGPHELQFPEGVTEADLVIGLFKDERVALQGPQLGDNRIHIAHLTTERDASGAILMKAEPVKPQKNADEQLPDFDARVNAPGTWIDFGKVATDGSVKINREKNRLVVFPYPRNKRFGLEIRLDKLVPGANTDGLQVRALSAGRQEDMGAIAFTLTDGRLRFDTGTPGAGRYVVSWQ